MDDRDDLYETEDFDDDDDVVDEGEPADEMDVEEPTYDPNEVWWDADADVECRQCGHVAKLKDYKPSMGLYTDCRCPNCRSTDNAHNDEYAKRLRANWNAS